MPRTALAILNQPTLHARAHIIGAAPFVMADPHEPQLSVRDLGITRGDGIFETISIVAGAPHALESHLARFTRSARTLDLPEPHLNAWRQAIAAVVAAMDPVAEGFVRAVLTRGLEGNPHSAPTGWVYASPSPDYSAARIDGVRVVLLDRGLRHDVQSTSPWLLTGAKTLSYAVNRAALREAVRRDADDVLFVSSDGFVLEGPTASLVYLRDGRLCTPATGLGILEGTTQGDIFQWADSRGLPTAFEQVTAAGLHATDAAWLVSSGRHAAPIRAIDGHPHPLEPGLTVELNSYLLLRGAAPAT